MSEDKGEIPACNVTLCGRSAAWKVDLFDRVEYYCQRHKPSIPETLMTRLVPA